jgi:hypothetical protein
MTPFVTTVRLSQLSDNSSLVGIKLMGQPFCGLISSGDYYYLVPPTPNHLQDWTLSTHADNGAIATCTTSAGTQIDCFELVNYHTNKSTPQEQSTAC